MSVLPKQTRKWWALAGVSVGSFLGCVDFTIVNTALPALQAQLNVSLATLQWVINGFLLAMSSFMVLAGRLADLFGRKRVLNLGLVVFGLASLIAGLAQGIEWLVVARVAQGLACAVLYTASGAIVGQTFSAQEQGKAFGVLFGVNGIGLAVGPVLGGLLTQSFGWPWIFLLNVPLVLLSLILIAVNVDESRSDEPQSRLDWPGVALLLIGLPSLVLVIVQGSRWGWGSSLSLGVLALAIIALGVFAWQELRTPSPIIDLQLFVNRRFTAAVLASFSLAVFYCIAFFVMPLYLSQVRGADSQTSGLLLLPTTLGVALLSPWVGRLVDRKGAALLIQAGLLLFAVSALLQIGFAADTSWLYVLSAFAVMGLGWACLLGPSTVLGVSSVPQRFGSVAVGSLMTLHNVGGGLGLALGAGVLRYHVQLMDGYRAVMIGLLVAMLLAWVGQRWLLSGGNSGSVGARLAREE
jgi:EmrB/QacA subfamily drug resistance transporter